MNIHIDIISDVVCPWCFIGKRRLEKALALRPEIASRHSPGGRSSSIPTCPRRHVPRRLHRREVRRPRPFAAAFIRPSPSRRLGRHRLRLRAHRAQPQHPQAHRLIRYATGPRPRPLPWSSGCSASYFLEGRDLGDCDTLADDRRRSRARLRGSVRLSRGGAERDEVSPKTATPAASASTPSPASSSTASTRSRARRSRSSSSRSSTSCAAAQGPRRSSLNGIDRIGAGGLAATTRTRGSSGRDCP